MTCIREEEEEEEEFMARRAAVKNEKLKKLGHWFILDKLTPGFMNSDQLTY